MTKFKEYYNAAKSDLEDTVDRLHQSNRARHELELRFHAELEAGYRLKQTIDQKIAIITEQEIKIEYFEMQRRQDLQKQGEF